jgi:hypothetical protein
MKVKKVKKLIIKHFKWWVHYLGLKYWSVGCCFEDDEIITDSGDPLAGETSVEWKYLRAFITFYPKTMRHLSESDIERVVIHELMHVFLNEMREDGIDHEERVATMLQKAFSWVKYSDREKNA